MFSKGGKYIVIAEYWYQPHRIVELIEETSPHSHRYRGHGSTPFDARNGVHDWWENNSCMLYLDKFQQAPIGYKVKPITIGERTFYV